MTHRLSRRIALAAIFAATVAGHASPACAGQDTLASIKAAGQLRVALEFGRPPWALKDATLKMTGSDYETAELLASDLGVKLDIVEVTGPNRIPFLQTKKADVVLSTFSITRSTSPVSCGSSAEVTSSNSMTLGSIARLRAMATRCC